MRWGVGVTVSKKAWSRPLTTKTWSALWAWRPATASQASKSARSTYCVVVADSSPKCSWAPNPTNHNRAPPTTPPPHQGSWPIENLWIFCLLREAPPLKAPDQSKECSLFRLRCSSSPKSSWPIQFCWFLFFVFLSCWLVFFLFDWSIDSILQWRGWRGNAKKNHKKTEIENEKKRKSIERNLTKKNKRTNQKKEFKRQGPLDPRVFFSFLLLFFKWIFFPFFLFFCSSRLVTRASSTLGKFRQQSGAHIFFSIIFFFAFVFKRFVCFQEVYRVWLPSFSFLNIFFWFAQVDEPFPCGCSFELAD